MCPTVSNAEFAVFNGLSQRGLTKGMITQAPIVLGTYDKEGRPEITLPDFLWISKRKILYLNSDKVHRKKQERDEEIKELLESKGFSVLRITYHSPLPSSKLIEILDQIQTFIGVP